MDIQEINIKRNDFGIWGIKKRSEWYFASSGNYIPFLPILELPVSDFLNMLKKEVTNFETADKIFPIIEILIVALESGSNYWIEKAMEFIFQLKLKDEKVNRLLVDAINNKKTSQKLRQNAQLFLKGAIAVIVMIKNIIIFYESEK